MKKSNNNEKKIEPIKDDKIECTCKKCLKEHKENEIHHITIPICGYMSRWDGFGTEIYLCEKCYQESIKDNKDLWKMECVDYIDSKEYGKKDINRCSSLTEDGEGIYDIDPDYIYEDEGYVEWPILKYETEIFNYIFRLPKVAQELVFNRLSFGFNSNLYKSESGDAMDWLNDKTSRFI